MLKRPEGAPSGAPKVNDVGGVPAVGVVAAAGKGLETPTGAPNVNDGVVIGEADAKTGDGTPI